MIELPDLKSRIAKPPPEPLCRTLAGRPAGQPPAARSGPAVPTSQQTASHKARSQQVDHEWDDTNRPLPRLGLALLISLALWGGLAALIL